MKLAMSIAKGISFSSGQIGILRSAQNDRLSNYVYPAIRLILGG